jgi:hypothetical protein
LPYFNYFEVSIWTVQTIWSWCWIHFRNKKTSNKANKLIGLYIQFQDLSEIIVVMIVVKGNKFMGWHSSFWNVSNMQKYHTWLLKH